MATVQHAASGPYLRLERSMSTPIRQTCIPQPYCWIDGGAPGKIQDTRTGHLRCPQYRATMTCIFSRMSNRWPSPKISVSMRREERSTRYHLLAEGNIKSWWTCCESAVIAEDYTLIRHHEEQKLGGRFLTRTVAISGDHPCTGTKEMQDPGHLAPAHTQRHLPEQPEICHGYSTGIGLFHLDVVCML